MKVILIQRENEQLTRVAKVIDIDPKGSMGLSKRSIKA
ncbi:hypothetical protein T11_12201 [Trichinella zimbabwensis]|uniref:Uncharacterized protein n=1 Tax=Trichinella zimbabwensis TaxID=268475 RepID=A0A0V1GG50_9BILA|nr:hypothetical protein T11_12201 [Trichinella zimbabwensis]